MKHKWLKTPNGENDEWAWESGYCNGVVCERCGLAVCVNCHPNYMELDNCISDEKAELIEEKRNKKELLNILNKNNYCICKECHYYEPERKYPDFSPLPWGYCYFWHHIEDCPNLVEEEDFCSHSKRREKNG